MKNVDWAFWGATIAGIGLVGMVCLLFATELQKAIKQVRSKARHQKRGPESFGAVCELETPLQQQLGNSYYTGWRAVEDIQVLVSSINPGGLPTVHIVMAETDFCYLIAMPFNESMPIEKSRVVVVNGKGEPHA